MPITIALVSLFPRFSSILEPPDGRDAVQSVAGLPEKENRPSSLALAERIIAETDMSPALRDLARRFAALYHGEGSKAGLSSLRGRLLGDANNEFQHQGRAVQLVEDLQTPHKFFNSKKPKGKPRKNRRI